MKITEYLKSHITYLDGGMGTLLQAQGLKPGERPERWNLSHPEAITAIHRAYYDAGSNVVNTNTFGANSLKFSALALFFSVLNLRTAWLGYLQRSRSWVVDEKLQLNEQEG